MILNLIETHLIARALLSSLLLTAVMNVSSGTTVDGDVYADSWVATDALGRSLPTYAEVGPPRPNRQVGLFYFLWVNNGVSNKQNIPVQDITKILAVNPLAPKWGGAGIFPLLG